MAERDVQTDELPLESAGSRLRRAREAAGLSLGDVAARTKIAERHLASIEQSRFADLASRTYAVGFARAYARAIGLSEAEIAQAVRNELAERDKASQPPQADVFEPGDPARVPGSRLAWIAGLGGVIVIALVFVFWRSFFSPAVTLPELTAPPEAVASASLAPEPRPASAPVPGGPVVFTAMEPAVWVKFYDAAGTQLMARQMAQGESYTVPADAVGPLIRTGRPDALQITIGGRIVPPLADKPTAIKHVPVSAAALLARAAPAAVPTPPAASGPVPQPAATPAPPVTQAPTARPAVPTAPPSRPAATRPTATRPASPRPSPAAAAPAALAEALPSPAPAPAPAAAPAGETSTVSN